MEEVYEILPPLQECNFGIFGGGKYPDGWSEMYMGAGNHLVICHSIEEKLRNLAKDLESPAELYQKWLDFVLAIINDSSGKH